MIVPLSGKKSLFHPAQIALINPERIPKHIAIIPDGNRRWAKKRLLSTSQGHQEGADVLMDTVKAAKELGVQRITFYSFSTENWNRPQEEIAALMLLYASYLKEHCEEMQQSGIRLDTIGQIDRLPFFLQEVIEETKKATADCDKITLILALNYGSRDEICRAFQAMVDDIEAGKLDKHLIDEKMVGRYLDTHPFSDPDLLIRTSGELRVSNFLLWQISYAEIHVAPTLWPDFTTQHLIDAIVDFQNRQRRWGGD